MQPPLLGDSTRGNVFDPICTAIHFWHLYVGTYMQDEIYLSMCLGLIFFFKLLSTKKGGAKKCSLQGKCFAQCYRGKI